MIIIVKTEQHITIVITISPVFFSIISLQPCSALDVLQLRRVITFGMLLTGKACGANVKKRGCIPDRVCYRNVGR